MIKKKGYAFYLQFSLHACPQVWTWILGSDWTSDCEYKWLRWGSSKGSLQWHCYPEGITWRLEFLFRLNHSFFLEKLWLQYSSHVIRIPKERIVKWILQVKLISKKLGGKPRTRWLEDIHNLSCSCMGIQLKSLTMVASDRTLWRKCLRTIFPMTLPGIVDREDG